MKTFFRSFCVFLVFLFSVCICSGQQYHFYFGNIHAHSAYSDGTKDHLRTHVQTPAECFRFAKQSKHLDFLGISDHNHSLAHMHLADFHKGLAEADAENEDGRFVCLYGMEYGLISNGGHVLVYGDDQLIGWEPGNFDVYSAKNNYASLFGLVAVKPGAFAALAHPHLTDFNSLVSQPYNPLFDRAIRGVAISSGPAFSRKTDYSAHLPLRYYGYYKKLLSLGYSVGPTMDQDNHYTTFGRVSAARTVILAESLTRRSIMEAYLANRFYASTDWNTQVSFTVNGAPMGSHLKDAVELAINVQVSDPDPGDVVKSIRLWYGMPGPGEPAAVLKSTSGPGNLETSFTPQPGKAYYFFAEVSQEDGDRMVTSPVWAVGKRKKDTSRSSTQAVPLASPLVSPLTVKPFNFITDISDVLRNFSKPAEEVSFQLLDFKFRLRVTTVLWTLFFSLACLFTLIGRYSFLLKNVINGTGVSYSWPRVQVAWWLVIFLTVFSAALLVEKQTPVIGNNFLILLSGNLVALVIAYFIDQKRMRFDPDSFRRPGGVPVGFLFDLLTVHGRVRLHRLQAVVVNFIFGVWFIIKAGWHIREIPKGGSAMMPDLRSYQVAAVLLSAALFLLIEFLNNRQGPLLLQEEADGVVVSPTAGAKAYA